MFLGAVKNFQKYNDYEVNSLNSPYDVRSVMHSGSFAYTKNGNPTITDKLDSVLNTQVRL